MSVLGHRATVEQKSAPLSGDFGREFAERKFGAALFDHLPRFSRGPRKGLVKGYILWDKCTRGGWFRGNGRGYVMAPGTRNVRIALSRDTFARSFGERNSFAVMSDEEWAATIKRGVNEIFNGG